jgi:hypothetical protein
VGVPSDALAASVVASGMGSPASVERMRFFSIVVGADGVRGGPVAGGGVASVDV